MERREIEMSEIQSGGAHWLFQGNPKRYDLKDRLKPGNTEEWVVTRYVTRIQPGDFVWFWRAGERALYGWGEVLEPPQSKPGLSGIRLLVSYEERFDPPIGMEDILAEAPLKNLMVLRAPQGTNFAVTPEEADALRALAEDRNFNAPRVGFTLETPLPFVNPGPEALQWLESYEGFPTLRPEIMQTVDLLMGIHDRAIMDNYWNPFGLWLAEALGNLSVEEGAQSKTKSVTPLSARLPEDWQGDEALLDAEITPEALEHLRLASNAYYFVLSPVVAESIDRAAQIEARLTPDDPNSDIRTPALIAALLFSDWPAVKHLLSSLNRSPSISKLREGFLARIGEVFGENAIAQWRPFTRLGAADLVLLGYAPDLAEGADALHIEPDVQAFASVIASQRLTPPLSIGLFGDWGSGKSFFMRKLRDQVENLAKSARVLDPANSDKLIENPDSDFLPNIVQIEFNAWHYVESNLWASLVTHLFENLRINAEDPIDVLHQRRDHLIQEMDTAARLRAIAEDERKTAHEQLARKRRRLRKLQYIRSQRRVKRSFREILETLKEQSYEDLLSDETETAIEQASSFRELNAAYQKIHHATLGARSVLGRTGRLWKGLRRLGWYNLVWLIGLIAVAAIVNQLLPNLLQKFGEELHQNLVTLAAVLSGAAVWLQRGLQKANSALGLIESAQSKLSTAMAESVPPPGEDERKLAGDLKNLENEIRIAEAQVEQAAARAEAAQVELVDIERSASLAYFIEQRAASGDYREQLGILALIRQDFDQLSERMKEMRKSRLPLDDPNRIDRIVLYIDDLDRCPAERVFEVLQAIHLLLAFDAFVVVVGVDERWLTRALALARAGLLRRHERSATETDKALKDLSIDPGDTARPSDFLEKIFQVAFWLQPMTPPGFEKLLDDMLTLDQLRLGAADGSLPDIAKTTAATKTEEAITTSSGNSTHTNAKRPTREALGMGNEPDEPGDITTAKPEQVAINSTEAEVMRKLAPILGRSPRTAKRFINLYRVLKAREFIASALNPLREAESLGGMSLLALVAGNPLGTKLVLDAIQAAPPEQGVGEFMQWEPQSLPEGSNPMDDSDPTSSTGLGQFRGKLPDVIGQVLAETAAAYLSDLRMEDLQRWLPTVRRFSFRSEIARDAKHAEAFSAGS